MKYSIFFSCLILGEIKKGYTNVKCKDGINIDDKLVKQRIIKVISKDRADLKNIKLVKINATT